MSRQRHLPVPSDTGDDEGTCFDCRRPWPCWSELVDRIVDTLPSADQLPQETRAKLTILLRPAA